MFHEFQPQGSDVFVQDIDVKIFDMDRSREVNGSLSWSSQLKALTAASITAMCDEVKLLMSQLETPVLSCHDPKDAVATIEGSRRLMEIATCKRQLCEIPGGLHAPHFNKQADFEECVRQFLVPCLATFPEAGADGGSPSSPQIDVLPEKAMPTFPSHLPVGLQRLRLEKSAFERFPLPGKWYETFVLIVYFICLMAIAFSPTLVAVAVGPEVGGWVLLAFGIYLMLIVMAVIVNYTKAIRKLRRACEKPQAPLKSVSFAILIPMYNEDFEVLQPGLKSINMQPQAGNIPIPDTYY